jgi:hypothetical protein
MNIELPRNGALISREDYELLRKHIQCEGSARERGMMRQMDAMLDGIRAILRDRDTERAWRLRAETDARNKWLQLEKARLMLSVSTSKLKVKELRQLVRDALAELEGEDG